MPKTVSENLMPGVPVVESMLFRLSIDDMGLTNAERDIAIQLNERGYAVFDFPDDELDARIERIIPTLTPHYPFEHWRKSGWANNEGLRIQDAWRHNDDIRAIATNQAVLDLLSKLYGRRAFPFQSLNFPVGTQQHYHSDSVHFSTIPERFMCGVWLALEDIHPDAGPLQYYPGSHRWPILYNDIIGKVIGDETEFLAQTPYEKAWEAMVEATGVEAETFCAKKGQALIWTANLLHGGSRQKDPARTRWSQVTHYYFENCAYYTPAFSDPLVGNLDLRDITDITTGEPMPNLYVDRPIDQVPRRGASGRLPMMGGRMGPTELPDDFDPVGYLAINQDVSLAGVDPGLHYLEHGWAEKRRYR
jgi:hypothetical protein